MQGISSSSGEGGAKMSCVSFALEEISLHEEISAKPAVGCSAGGCSSAAGETEMAQSAVIAPSAADARTVAVPAEPWGAMITAEIV
jgi:hypothetical protein